MPALLAAGTARSDNPCQKVQAEFAEHAQHAQEQAAELEASNLDVRGLAKAKKAILPPARTEHCSYCQAPREPCARCANCGAMS